MKNSIVLIYCLLFSVLACKQLDSKEYQLANDCSSFAQKVLDSIDVDRQFIHFAKINPDDCTLLIRYDKSVNNLSLINEFLSRNSFLFVEKIDSTIIDSTLSLVKDTLLVNTPVVQEEKQQVEADEVVPLELEKVDSVESDSIPVTKDSIQNAVDSTLIELP